ncbi:hypothetical protein GCK72_016053 [Caenorhabditis remanei]|uniref:non-specific serine/threonine protein kinase n=1 Tax=Caenorhabditis remanei TaxID=31234 RepID=A0A6A5GYC6_CAERE|nr:hypothetical protein GCK72_016053 [Caenorhabditis remanei]KAF1759586.1 hypothetical protein GCK72_016053 [Caenorhabditis remanei]
MSPSSNEMNDEEADFETPIESGFEYALNDVIYQGAEGKITKCLYLGREAVVKERFSKGYRHPTLDTRLNKARTKQEVRGMWKARELGIITPTVYFIDSEKNQLIMEYIRGPTAKWWISQLKPEEFDQKMDEFGRILGEILGKLHRGGLIHGDLTTSNMILKEGCMEKLALIDFGLSQQGKDPGSSYSKTLGSLRSRDPEIQDQATVTPEEKGVDLYVLERAVVSTHHNSHALLAGLMEGYKTADGKQFTAVEKKLNEIRLRGRKRDMIG